jgi:hypothetical protein
MIIFRENIPPFEFNEMATSCHPRADGGKYPMWIRVEYTNGEHHPPHAHLYRPDGRPSAKSFITKFLITLAAPRAADDIQVMRGQSPIPVDYAKLVIQWAKDKDKLGINNWLGLWRDWNGLEDTFK